jgi:hypothetical protein
MTTPTAPHPAVVALPPKALKADDWEPRDDGRFYRFCDGETRDIATDSKYGPDIVGVRAHVMQYDDGSIDDGAISAPQISLDTTTDVGEWSRADTGIHLSSAAARRLADVLVTAADEIDGWATR